jgi:alkaline phosphatase D
MGVVCLCLLGAALACAAEKAPAKKPPAKKRRQRRRQYKKAHFPGMKLLEAGKHAEALTFFENYLAEKPDDLEALFGLTAAHAGLGELDKAMASAKKAVGAGLPLGRFIAGPRHWLKPLTDSQPFRQFAKQAGSLLVHGPMPGCVTDRSAKFWVRTASVAQVEVLVSRTQGAGSPIRSTPAWTSRKSDFTTVVEVDGLDRNTIYRYDILVNGQPMLAPKFPAFRTFPAPLSKARFQVAFGGGAGYVPAHERMWTTIASFTPLAFLFLGDNVYHDTPTIPAIQRYCYYRRQSRPEFRRFIASTAIYAVWDDHDFGTNDCIPGPKIDDPPWKMPVWRIFCRNWANPYYGGGEKAPGCWFHFTIGDVDFFMTDSRFYRTHPRKENPTLLGPVQKQWLLERLKASKATFKVLANGVPWALGTKPGSLDTWEGFKDEREEIFSCIAKNRIGGVVLLSADRHRSDVWKIKRDVGYTLHEFESSRLTNQHVHGRMPGAAFSYNAKQSFGLLTFDTKKRDPEVTYEIYSIDREKVHSITLLRSDLTPR